SVLLTDVVVQVPPRAHCVETVEGPRIHDPGPALVSGALPPAAAVRQASDREAARTRDPARWARTPHRRICGKSVVLAACALSTSTAGRIGSARSTSRAHNRFE